jgi:hypothetical protein
MTFNALSASFATPMTEVPFFESNSISNLLINGTTNSLLCRYAFKIGPAKARDLSRIFGCDRPSGSHCHNLRRMSKAFALLLPTGGVSGPVIPLPDRPPGRERVPLRFPEICNSLRIRTGREWLGTGLAGGNIRRANRGSSASVPILGTTSTAAPARGWRPKRGDDGRPSADQLPGSCRSPGRTRQARASLRSARPGSSATTACPGWRTAAHASLR